MNKIKKHFAKQRARFCGKCEVGQCDTCSIGRNIEALTIAKMEEQEKNDALLSEKLTELNAILRESCAAMDIELIDCGHVLVKFKNKTYQRPLK